MLPSNSLNSRFSNPDDFERVGSGPNVRHNLTGREILVLNGIEPHCPPTAGELRLRAARLQGEIELYEALEAIGWE